MKDNMKLPKDDVGRPQ